MLVFSNLQLYRMKISEMIRIEEKVERRMRINESEGRVKGKSER